jgi:SAM-dependent methyltransferase
VLSAITESADDGHVMIGTLTCTGCAISYQILGGIPRFMPQAISDSVSKTVRGFGYEWTQYDSVLQETQFSNAETFLDFIAPVNEAFIQGKSVLDAGCGMGRFTRLSVQLGAKFVVGVDLSNAVEAAFNHTRQLENVLIIQADIFALPLKAEFDYSFSVGVLHHTPDPRKAFDSLVRTIRPGGSISTWVYGRENNGWIIHILNPIRHNITSKLPLSVLRVLAYGLAIPMYLATKGIYRPVGQQKQLTGLRKRLFYFEYLYFLSQFDFNAQSSVIFDHLVPEIAYYIAHDDFARWFSENHLESVVISDRAKNSWRGFGTKSA